jgi:hypothetical protein
MISGLFRSIKRSISHFVLHVSLSLCKGYGFAGTPPAADPAVADAVAGEIRNPRGRKAKNLESLLQ